MLKSPSTYQLLEDLYASRSALHLANDPLSFCHRFDDPRDQEVAAVIASTFAYGGIKIILRTLESIFAELGPSPRRFIENFNPASGLKTFNRFKHRFNDGRDLCALLWGIRRMLEEAGSVENFFLAGYDDKAADITSALNSYTSAVFQLDYSPVFGQPSAPVDSYFPFMFPAPSSGSACKRLCMFLRWVVRPSDNIDLGIWHDMSPSSLIIPVDTHIQRISGYLGFTRRKNADWRMAQEITGHLRRLNPNDPIRYDFSLAHLGISEKCNGSDPVACLSCSIAGICTSPGTKAIKRP